MIDTTMLPIKYLNIAARFSHFPHVYCRDLQI